MLKATNREIINNNTSKLNHFKQYTYEHTAIKEIIPNKSYKLLQEKSLQTVLTNYYQIIIPNNTYKLLPQKSLPTILTNHYQRNHSKLCLQKFISADKQQLQQS